MVLFSGWGIWYVWDFFNGNHSPSKNKNTIMDEKQAPSALAVPVPIPVVSRQWRVSGVIIHKAGRFVVLSGADGRQRVEPATGFVFNGAIISGVLDGEVVTTWSGGGTQQ